MDLMEKLTEAGERTASYLTSADAFGGAVAYRTSPCIVIYNVPVWIMPNGMCRLGDPNAPMIDAEHAARTIRDINREKQKATS